MGKALNPARCLHLELHSALAGDVGQRDQGRLQGLHKELPIVSIVVPFWGYLLGSLMLNQKKELQWRL